MVQAKDLEYIRSLEEFEENIDSRNTICIANGGERENSYGPFTFTTEEEERGFWIDYKEKVELYSDFTEEGVRNKPFLIYRLSQGDSLEEAGKKAYQNGYTENQEDLNQLSNLLEPQRKLPVSEQQYLEELFQQEFFSPPSTEGCI